MKRDFMLIHGYILNPDGSIDPILEDRLNYGLALLQHDGLEVEKVIVAGRSGGSQARDFQYVEGTGITQAHKMRDWLANRHIDPSNILLEDIGTTTWSCTEKAYNSLIVPQRFRSGIVVSTAEHLPRLGYQTMQIFDAELFGNTIFGGPTVKDPEQRAKFLEWEAKSVQAYTLPSLVKYAESLRQNTSQPRS